ncbi:PREDICTED: uncharacterized protein LOC101820193 [Ficedula albicollis]|uniref:uncharacterized protein LOC101820193 n=1 Tax=Ficedula albicollis TaxID=59894 RepID=UPI0007AD9029|nr:PREDICTED: uncharacterized protein LOC101820193 [Ficedula albicollis]
MMSFKRRPSEEPDRSFWAHGSRQQQDGLENREPRSRGQGSSLRRSRALSDTPGQDSKRSLPAPKEGLSCLTDERRGASGRPEGSKVKKCPLDEEDEGKDGRATVTPAAEEEHCLVGEEAAAGPDPGQAFTYTIPFSTFLDTLAEGSQMLSRKVLNILQKALIAVQDKEEQKRQHPTGSKEPVVAEPAQSIKAEQQDMEHPVKQGAGQQLVEAESVLELCRKEATEAGTPAGPTFRSPSPTVVNALARERRTSVFKSAPRALPSSFSAMHRRGEWEQQQPTACAQDLPHSAQCSEVLSKTTVVIQGLQQTKEQEYLAHSMDSPLAVRAAGAVSLAHGPRSPTADGLAHLDTAPDMRDELLSKAAIVIQGSEVQMIEQRDLEQGTGGEMRVTAPGEGTERPGHTVHSGPAGVPVFLEHNDYIQTEVDKKAVLTVQKPFQHPDEEQDQKLSTEESTGAEGPADYAQNLSAPVVIHTLARVKWLKLVSRALGVWGILRALRLAAAATADAGKEKEEKEQKEFIADARYVLNIVEHIRTVQDKAALGMHASSQQIRKQQCMEHSADVSLAVTPTAAGAERQAHENHSSTADTLVFLDYNDYIRTEVVKKAMLVVQKPFKYPEEQQEPSAERSTMAERPLDCAQSLPAPMVINTLARQRWLRLVWRSLRVLRLGSKRTSSTEEKKELKADATDVLDTAKCIRTDVQETTPGMHAPSQHTVEQQGMKHKANVSSAVTPPAAGADRQTHKTHGPRTDAPVFLDYSDCIHTEVVKKAMLMVQKPFEYPEEEQDQELSTEESIGAEGPADYDQSLPEVINTPAQLRLLRRVSQAQEVWRVLRALHLGTTVTSDTGKEKEKQLMPQCAGKGSKSPISRDRELGTCPA